MPALSAGWAALLVAILMVIAFFGGGDLGAKAPILTDDEMGGLASGFNTMLDAVRDREFIKETFGKYVPAAAKAILENRGEFEPEQRLATILFTDIQGFTTLCEGLDPAAVADLLNDYFSLPVSVLDRHGGVVNQFQSDAIRAAFEIQDALAGHDFKGGVEMITRIGINTGNVIAGSVGAKGRLNYTVHGDAVNIAARLESLNKEFGTRILVSAETKDRADGGFAYAAKGDLTIRGKSETVGVFEAARAAARSLASPVSPVSPAPAGKHGEDGESQEQHRAQPPDAKTVGH